MELPPSCARGGGIRRLDSAKLKLAEAFLEHDPEQDQQIEVGAREINLIQHIAETVSLVSCASDCHSGREPKHSIGAQL